MAFFQRHSSVLRGHTPRITIYRSRRIRRDRGLRGRGWFDATGCLSSVAEIHREFYCLLKYFSRDAAAGVLGYRQLLEFAWPQVVSVRQATGVLISGGPSQRQRPIDSHSGRWCAVTVVFRSLKNHQF